MPRISRVSPKPTGQNHHHHHQPERLQPSPHDLDAPPQSAHHELREASTRSREIASEMSVPLSLGRASGWRTCVLVSTMIVASHFFFGFAQLSGVDEDCPGYHSSVCPQRPFHIGGLGQGIVHLNVDYTAKGLLASVFGLVERGICKTDCPNFDAVHQTSDVADTTDAACKLLSCDSCVEAGGLELEQSCHVSFEETVVHMSYFYSVDHLWAQDKSLDGDHPSHVYPGRPAAAIIFICSFIWPHIKLFLMHFFFYFPLSTAVRRNGNYWLAFWGKWTLADVLVMCVLIGLFNLTVLMSVPELWQRIKPDVPMLCDLACEKYANSNHTLHPPSSEAEALILAALKRFFPAGQVPAIPGQPAGHVPGGTNCSRLCDWVAEDIVPAVDATVAPEGLPSSSIDANLRMRGLASMYSFCIAVLLSLSLSVLVEWLDDKLRSKQQEASTARLLQEGCTAPLAEEQVISEHLVTPLRTADALEIGSVASNESRQLSESLLRAQPHTATNDGRQNSSYATMDANSRSGAAVPLPGSPPSTDSPHHTPDNSGYNSNNSSNHCNSNNTTVMSNSLPARLRLPAGGEAQMGVLSHITSATSSSSGDDCAGCVPSRRLPKDFTDESSKRSRLCSLYSAIGLIHTLGLLLQLTLTVLAFTVPVFERNVYGSLPDALRVNLGIDFNDSYNMIKLAKMAAQAGGLDYFMSATFWVFIVICPTLRPVTQLILLHVPMTPKRQRSLHTLSRHVAAYYAFEVMLVAVPLIHMAFGPMSAAMLNKYSFGEVCNPLLALYPNPSETCFEMRIDESLGYTFTIAAVGVFLLTGFDGSPTHKYMHKKLYPDDRPPPTCGRFY